MRVYTRTATGSPHPRSIVLAVGTPEMLVLAACAVWLVAGVWLAVTDYRAGILPTGVIWPA